MVKVTVVGGGCLGIKIIGKIFFVDVRHMILMLLFTILQCANLGLSAS